MSNESKLRTGEWRFIPNAGDGGGIRDNSGFICFLTKPFCYPEQEERYFSEIEEYQQTKNLITAAPEMLEALELCADYIKDLQSENFEDLDVGIRYDYQLRKAHDALMAAIKKAKGGI